MRKANEHGSDHDVDSTGGRGDWLARATLHGQKAPGGELTMGKAANNHGKMALPPLKQGGKKGGKMETPKQRSNKVAAIEKPKLRGKP